MEGIYRGKGELKNLSLPGEFPHIAPEIGAIDIALRVGGDAFRQL
jgi:hypothetical protein